MMVSLDTNFLQKCRLLHINPKFLDFEDSINNKSHSNGGSLGSWCLACFHNPCTFFGGKEVGVEQRTNTETQPASQAELSPRHIGELKHTKFFSHGRQLQASYFPI